MIIIFSQKSRRIQKTIYLFWKKHQKIHNLYNSDKKGVTRTDKNEEEYIYIYIYISYRLQFIDNARFAASSLSNLVNLEGIHKM